MAVQIPAQVICTRVKPVQGLPLSYFKYKQKIPALYEKVINFSKKVYIYKNTGTGVRFQLKGSAGKKYFTANCAEMWGKGLLWKIIFSLLSMLK